MIGGDGDLYENAGGDQPLGLAGFFFNFFLCGWTIFKSLYRICYNIASGLCFGFLASRHVEP